MIEKRKKDDGKEKGKEKSRLKKREEAERNR